MRNEFCVTVSTSLKKNYEFNKSMLLHLRRLLSLLTPKNSILGCPARAQKVSWPVSGLAKKAFMASREANLNSTFGSYGFCLIALFCVLHVSLSFAQDKFASAMKPQTVGNVTFVIGKANVKRAQEIIALMVGSELKVGDELMTPANGHVHIRFVDGALVSLRPSSVLKINEYLFDASNPAASLVKFDLDKGVLRAISGQAAESAKDKFRLNTPLVAIGVKGTDFVVEATQARVSAIVNQGAIVLAPFDAGCRMDALGPCSTRFAKELNASAKGMAITFSMNMPSPQMLPTGQLKGSELLNLASPLSSAGSSNGVGTPGSNGVVSSNPSNMPLGSGSTNSIQPSNSQANTDNANNKVQQTRVDAKAYVGVNEILLNTSTTDSLTWGRWGAQNAQDNLTVPFINALQGKSVTVGDGYFFLFRNESKIPNLMALQQGNVNFGLVNSHAYFLDLANNMYSASASNGVLGINFSNQTYSTLLNLNAQVPSNLPSTLSGVGTSPQTLTQTLQSSGKINLNSGIFLSNAPQASSAGQSAPNPSVAGAISLDTKQAGYLFTLPSSGGQFKGATLWGR